MVGGDLSGILGSDESFCVLAVFPGVCSSYLSTLMGGISLQCGAVFPPITVSLYHSKSVKYGSLIGRLARNISSSHSLVFYPYHQRKHFLSKPGNWFILSLCVVRSRDPLVLIQIHYLVSFARLEILFCIILFYFF